MRLQPIVGMLAPLKLWRNRGLANEDGFFFGDVESPLIQREGFVQKEGVFMQFKKLIDAGLPVGLLACSLLHRRMNSLIY